MFQTMLHNIDLAYTYQKLQADGYLAKGNYADFANPLFGELDKKYTLNYLYVNSMRWKDRYLAIIILGTASFIYGLAKIPA